MIDRKARALHYFTRGRNEGQLDPLSESQFDTIEDRAKRAFSQLGYRGYRKNFISGYILGVEDTRNNGGRCPGY